MANLVLIVEIGDLNVSVAAPAFLRKLPMPQISNPDNPGQMIDKYATTKLWMETWLKCRVLKVINAGIDLQANDVAQKLTEEIFI